MTQPTPKQIELSKQIWEAGVRVEKFEWCFSMAYGLCRCLGVLKYHHNGYNRQDVKIYLEKKAEYKYIPVSKIIPILDFEDAVKWLDGKGWLHISLDEECNKYEVAVLGDTGLSITNFHYPELNQLTEAILACMLEVARRGR